MWLKGLHLAKHAQKERAPCLNRINMNTTTSTSSSNSSSSSLHLSVMHIQRDLAHCLRSVCVEEDVAAAADVTYLLDGLDDACTT